MTPDNLKSAAQKVRGSIKEALGKLTGDTEIEEQGALEKEETKSAVEPAPIAKNSSAKIQASS